MTPCEKQVTLRAGDYIATNGLSEDDYHNVAAEFMAAGAGKGEYPDISYAMAEDMLPNFGWFEGELYHGNGEFEGRQLTLSQILSATNAGGVSETTTETTTEEKPMPQQHLADQLEAALVELEQAQSEVDRLQAEYRAAYPKIHGEALTEDMTDPANWRAGDWVVCVDPEKTNESPYFTKGKEYKIVIADGSNPYQYKDDEGDDMWAYNEGFRFVRRP